MPKSKSNESELAHALLTGLTRIAHAITANVGPSSDETGCTVWSLTEAVMGTTAALCRIADAIETAAGRATEIADAIDRVERVATRLPSSPPPPPEPRT